MRNATWRRIGERPADRLRELGRDFLVGVDAQHPVVARERDREALLRTEAAPRLLDDARAVPSRDVARGVVAARIDDDDLVAERERPQARRELIAGVVRDQDGGDRKRRGGHRLGRPATERGGDGSFVRAAMRTRSCVRRSGASVESPDRQPARIVSYPIRWPAPRRRLAAAPTARRRRIGSPMTRVLVIKTSSMGDVVHNLPVIADLRRADAGRRHRLGRRGRRMPTSSASSTGIERVVPVALRRWRRAPHRASTHDERRAFGVALRAERYDVVLDTQGLLKSALIALSRAARAAAGGASASRSASSASRSPGCSTTRGTRSIRGCTRSSGCARSRPRRSATTAARSGRRASSSTCRRGGSTGCPANTTTVASRRAAACDRAGREVVAGGALERARRGARRGRDRAGAAVGQRRRARGGRRPSRVARRSGPSRDRRAAADARRLRGAVRAGRRRSSASTPDCCISPPRSTCRRSACSARRRAGATRRTGRRARSASAASASSARSRDSRPSSRHCGSSACSVRRRPTPT